MLEVLNDCGYNFPAGLHFYFIILIIVVLIATVVIISVVTYILYKKKQRENKSILRYEQKQDNFDGKSYSKI
jgi:flagellar basal body-associated protein FliL